MKKLLLLACLVLISGCANLASTACAFGGLAPLGAVTCDIIVTEGGKK
jgi:hypothetical protein